MKTRYLIWGILLLASLTACRHETRWLAEAQARFDEGLEQRTAKQSEAAAQAFSEALLAIDRCDLSKPETQRLKADIEDNLGAMYYLHGLFDDALPLLNDAIDLARQLNDSIVLMNALRDNARTLASLQRIEEAETDYNEALAIAKRLNDNALANNILIETARDVYLPNENYEKAIAASTEALESTDRTDICHLNLGLAYYYLADDSLALVHLDEATRSSQAGIRMSAYQTLSYLSQFQGDFPQALEYQTLFNENMMQADRDHRSEQVQRIKAEYDLQMQKNQLQSEQKLRNLYLYLIVGSLLAALVVVLLLLRQKTLAARLKSEERKNELELELKKNKVYVTALALTEQITASTLDFDLKESDWDDFVGLVNKVYGDFTKRLLEKYPTLTKSDLQICCLAKQGFSNQVISILLSLQTASYARRKSRIKQEKMNGLEEDRSFEEILNTI